ncbi:MAG: amidase [Paracoccaceae bacterium]
MGVSLHEYLQRAAIVNAEIRKMSVFFDQYDVLLTAATNGPAHVLGKANLDQNMDFDAFVAMLLELTPFLVPFNASGQLPITLPGHQTPEGLPIGVKLVSGFAQDGLLLQLASQLEGASNWQSVAPMLPS